MLLNYGIEIESAVLQQRFSSVSDEEMFSQIFSENGMLEVNLASVFDIKKTLIKEAVSFGVNEVRGAGNLISRVHEEGYALAVASGSPLNFVVEIVSALNLNQYFSTLVSSEEVAFGKPAPDVFLEAARRLKIRPEDCLVIEDGRSGMAAAKAAGMKCIGLVGNFNDDYPTNLLVESLEKITKEYVSRIF